MPQLLAADWFEVVAALVFLLITGAAQLLQKRGERRRRGEPEPLEPDEYPEPVPDRESHVPPAGERPRPMVRADWEEQLRRLLEGEGPPPPASPPPPPPPIVAQTQTPTHTPEFPPPLLAPPPAGVYRRPVPEPSPVGEGAVAAQGAGRIEEWRQTTAQRLGDATAAIRSAGKIRTRAIVLRVGAGRSAAKSSSSWHVRPAQAARPPMFDALRERETLRRAIIAATILNAPKALEESTPRVG